MIHLRNLHPKQTVYVPVAPGWCRVLRPGVTSALPAAVLHAPATRTLLTRQLVTVVDGAAWNPETRQARALRADMARAIAQAEQAEFDRLRAPLRLRPRRKADGRYTRWAPERLALFRTLWATPGVSLTEIAAAVGVARPSLFATAHARGLPGRRTLCQAAAKNEPQRVSRPLATSSVRVSRKV